MAPLFLRVQVGEHWATSSARLAVPLGAASQQQGRGRAWRSLGRRPHARRGGTGRRLLRRLQYARVARHRCVRSSKSSGSSQRPAHGGTAALQASTAADQGGALKHRFGQLSFTPAQCSTNCCTGGQLQGARQSDPGEGAGLHGKVSTRTQTQLPSSARFACMLAVLTFDWFFQM